MLTRKKTLVMAILVGAFVGLVVSPRTQALVREGAEGISHVQGCLETEAQAINDLELPAGLAAGAEEGMMPLGVEVPGKNKYKADEIIVKFKKPLSDIIEQQLAGKTEPKNLRLSTSLDSLNRKHKVGAIEPVFRNFKANRERMSNLRKKDSKLLNSEEKKLLKRLKRAPKGITVPELDRIYLVKLEAGQSAEQAVADYSKDPAVEYAELNYIVSICLTPNDPNYPEQWALNNIGQMYPASGSYGNPPGTEGCDINAPEAWDIYTGSSEVVVAVIDTGVDYNHRDLQGNMWVNTGEIPGDSLDNDENGYIDDFYGYDFCRYGQVRDSDPMDDMGHGTHCAGIIAARTDNSLDIAGVSWNAKIMAVKSMGASGVGYLDDAADALRYAADEGGDILSNSWTGPNSNTVREAVEYTVSQGAIVVAAAGNNNSSSPRYPADYNDVISVAATDSNDDKASFSNYGDWVNIAAPGVDILSLRAFLTVMGTWYGKKLTVASGTSMACPHVAGACALLLSVNSYLTLDDVNEIIMTTADELDDPNICASGRLNVYEAMLGAISSKGYINLDRPSYGCDANVGIFLSDFDLAAEPNQIVTISTDGNDSETVDLNEIGLDIGVFTGSIATESDDPCVGDGVLQVSDGETIMVLYQDVNIGDGNSAEPNDTATVDCVVPIISNMSFAEPLVGPEQVVTFQTSELTTAQVICGTSCGEPNIVAEYPNPQLNHTIQFKGMEPLTDYYFEIEATDLAGNMVIDSNNGNCYWFVTDEGPRDINVPGDYNTIQQAIDAAWDGSTVWISDGTYTGNGNRNIDFKGRAITVRSVNGPNNCIIDCQNLNRTRAFIFQNEEEATSVLQGLTMTNGHAGSSFGYGGGAIETIFSSPRIEGCVFRANWGAHGGAVYNLYGAPEINNCTFTENQASGVGGAIRDGGGQLTITHCLFSENSADLGGAIYALFTDLILDGCTFSENWAASHGGVTFLTGEYATVTNCTFLSNSSGGKGGGIFNQSWLSGQIIFQAINCTFSGNIAGSKGGGICNGYNNNSTVINCILWGNDASDMNEIANLDGGVTNISYSDIEGCGGSGAGWDPSLGADNGGNIDEDPCFADANDYHLSANSPCINAGDPNGDYDGQTDIDNYSRVVGGRVDIGADEYSRVDNITQKKGYFSIQEAINEAVANDVIVVYPWTYYENIDFGGKAVTVRSSDPNDWDVVAGTVIDSNGAFIAVAFDSGEDANSVLSGLTVTTGNGHGIDCLDSSPKINKCIITDNYMGVWCVRSTPSITNNIIKNNSTDGISAVASTPLVQNSWIYNSGYFGIRINPMVSSPAVISNNTIVANSYGIGYYDNRYSPIINNCILWNNNYDLDRCSATYSCIKDCNDATGTGNICGDANDPCFVDAGSYDLHLQANSPCVNAGNPDGNYAGQADIDGELRVDSVVIDMGADEWADIVAPSPNPMTWVTEPYVSGPYSIAMVATTATDVSGVEYYFECTAGGGNDSGWQDSTSYEDTGLRLNTTYTYRVKARDKSNHQNETGWSALRHATTPEWVILVDGESFEGAWPVTNWSVSGAWNKESDRVYDANYSADFDGSNQGGGLAGNMSTGNLDCNDATEVLVEFYGYSEDADEGDYYLDYYDKNGNWNQIQKLDNLGGGSWAKYSDTITDPDYFHSNFKVRWRVVQLKGGKHVYVDMVTIKKKNDPKFIGWWTLDEGSGSIAYDSIGDNDGGLTGDPNWVTGKIGSYALDFDGVDDYVEVNDPPDGSLDFGDVNFSISLWFKTTDTDGEVVDKSGGNRGRQTGYSVYVGTYSTINNGEIGFRVSDGTNRDLIKTNHTYNDGDWHHLAAVRTGSGSANLDIYVDGVDVSTSSVLNEVASGINNSYDLSIGAKYDAGDTNTWENFLDGTIDDVRIYDRGLTTEEIWQLYQDGL